MSLEERVARWHGIIMQHAPGFLSAAEVAAALGTIEEGLAEAMVDARVQRALLGAVKAKLDADPTLNRSFSRSTGWKILDQLLAAARLKELTHVKIVKRGGSGGVRYDVGELADSFYGAEIMKGLGFGTRRRVLDKKEFEKVEAEFAKIKLTLPEAIEPTTTEKFFAKED